MSVHLLIAPLPATAVESITLLVISFHSRTVPSKIAPVAEKEEEYIWRVQDISFSATLALSIANRQLKGTPDSSFTLTLLLHSRLTSHHALSSRSYPKLEMTQYVSVDHCQEPPPISIALTAKTLMKRQHQ